MRRTRRLLATAGLAVGVTFLIPATALADQGGIPNAASCEGQVLSAVQKVREAAAIGGNATLAEAVRDACNAGRTPQSLVEQITINYANKTPGDFNLL